MRPCQVKKLGNYMIELISSDHHSMKRKLTR